MKTFKQYLAEQNYGSLVNQTKYDGADRADKALYLYTADGFTSLSSVIDTLVKRYPYKGGTIYRGLHFEDKKQHDEFLTKIGKGFLEIPGESSWTPHDKTAVDFAHSKKSYFPTPELMRASRKMQETGDHMTGYGGVVLKTTVKNGIGCDVSLSEFGKESEVILPSGTYEVEVHKLIEPYHRKYDTPEKVNDILIQLSKAKARTSSLDKLKEYVMKSWLKKLEPSQVDTVIKYSCMEALKMPNAELGEKAVRGELRSRLGSDGKTLELSVYVPIGKNLYDLATPALQSVLDKKIKAIEAALKKAIVLLLRDIDIDQIENFDISGIEYLQQYSSGVDKAIEPLKKLLVDKYNRLNSREVSRMLKTTQAIRDHAGKIEAVVKAMANL